MHYDPRQAPVKTYISETLMASDIASYLKGEVQGPDMLVESIATYAAAIDSSISFQKGNTKDAFKQKRVVLCHPKNASGIGAITKILVKDPRASYLNMLSLMAPNWSKTTQEQFDLCNFEYGKSDIHHTAIIENGAIIGKDSLIEPNVIIKCGTIIGHHTHISAGTILGAHGPAVYQAPNKLISYAKLHYGTLHIGDNVEIGSSCVISKALLGRTLLGKSSIVGNMVHIGHGSEVRSRVWLAHRVTICGHVLVDHEVSVGAGATLRDNITIGRGASIGMGSAVISDVSEKESVVGVPANKKKLAKRPSPKL